MSNYDSDILFTTYEKYKKKFTASKTGTILIKVFNICFYVTSLTWIAYITCLFIEGLPERGDWFFYYFFHSTLVGLITYKALIDLKLKDSNFYKKNHLVLIFVSFAVTAPLVNLPYFIQNLPMGGTSEWSFSTRMTIHFFHSGQLYWLLLPIQVAITVYGQRSFLLILGNIVLYVSVFNLFTTYAAILAFSVLWESLHQLWDFFTKWQ